MTGKEKCTLLKSIRCHIAKKNGIDYTTTECTFQGECKGTCPKCEGELRYLANELEKIKHSGKRVALAGIAAAMVATSATGCARQEMKDPFVVSQLGTEETEDDYEIGEIEIQETVDGDIAEPDLEGKIMPSNPEPDDTTPQAPPKNTFDEIMGDINIDYIPFTIEHFIELNKDEQWIQLEGYLRHELQELWADSLTEQTETADVYVYGEKTLAITYQEDGTVEDFILSWLEE